MDDSPVRPLVVGSTTLVAREKELARLMDLVERPPAIGLIEGEAGIGKTRLVRELLGPGRVPQRCRVLVGHCHPLREPFPFGPVAEAVEAAGTSFDGVRFGPAAGPVARIVPEIQHLLPSAQPAPSDPRAERHILIRSLRALMQDLGPSLLILEDLHWADEATVEFLIFLKTRLPPELVVVVTFRREELAAGFPLSELVSRLPIGVAGEHIHLEPLDVGEVSRLVSAILQTDEVSEEFAAYILERTAGVPFAVEEVVHLLQDRQAIIQKDGSWVRRELEELQVPPTLAGSIVERLARLPDDARAFIEAAAVLKSPAAEGLIARVAGISNESATAAASRALSSALLQDAGRHLVFRHPLARDAVEASLPAPVRRRLHAIAARHVVRLRPKPCSRLAHHHKEAGNERQWVRYAQAAAEQAASHGDDAEAYRLLKQVIRSPLLGAASRGGVAKMLARSAYHSAAYEDAVIELRAVLEEEAIAPIDRGEIRLFLGMMLTYLADGDAVNFHLATAAEELEGHPELQARALAALGLPESGDAHASQHLEWSRRAIELLPEIEDPVLSMAVGANHASTLLALGHPSGRRAAASVPHGSSMEEKRERIRSCFNILNNAAAVGHLSEARALLTEAQDLSRELQYDRLALDLADATCFLDWMEGSWDGLQERCRDLQRENEESAFSAAIVLGFLLLAFGEIDQAEAQLRRAIGITLEGTSPVDHPWAVAGLARLLLARGDVHGAAHESLAAFELHARKGMWARVAILLPPLVESLIATGGEQEATRLLGEVSDHLEGRDAPRANATLMMTRGVLASADGSYGRALDWFGRAEAAWRSMPSVYDAALASEQRGVSLLALDRIQGVKALELSLEDYESLGARWDANRVRHTMRAHGISLVHRRGRKGYGVHLSPREREVATLAAEGFSNREIGENLFLAGSTVKHHLASAMRKLGVGVRADLRLPAEK